MNSEPSRYARQVAEVVSRVEAIRDSKPKPSGWVEFREAMRIELDDATVDLLVNALHDSDLQVRKKAAWVLGGMRSVRTIEPLLQYLHNPENLNRGGAASALGSIDDAAVVQPLLEALRDPEADVRSAAMSRLARRGEVSAVEPFLQAFRRVLSNEEDAPEMRWEIVMWIRLLSEKLGDKATFAFTRDALEILKDDADPLMRREAGRTLEWLKTP